MLSGLQKTPVVEQSIETLMLAALPGLIHGY
jgi:hypothetical protein